MAFLKLYNEDKVVELLNDNCDTENPCDAWSFDGNNGDSLERTLFLLVDETTSSSWSKKHWKRINIIYNMMTNVFYIDSICHEDGFEIDLGDDEEILEYFMINTDDIIDFHLVRDNISGGIL